MRAVGIFVHAEIVYMHRCVWADPGVGIFEMAHWRGVSVTHNGHLNGGDPAHPWPRK
jgi:hypothetical protein